MKAAQLTLSILILLVAVALVVPAGCSGKKSEQKTQTEKSENKIAPADLPVTVVAVVQDHFPGIEMNSAEVSVEDGFTLYDIELKDNKGEIEVAADGTVIELGTIAAIDELPDLAAVAIKAAAEGMTINRIEKSEIYSDVLKEGGRTMIAPLDPHRFVYEAELSQNGRQGEITVDSDGKVIEPFKWESAQPSDSL